MTGVTLVCGPSQSQKAPTVIRQKVARTQRKQAAAQRRRQRVQRRPCRPQQPCLPPYFIDTFLTSGSGLLALS